jgi:hypothetical protein
VAVIVGGGVELAGGAVIGGIWTLVAGWFLLSSTGLAGA